MISKALEIRDGSSHVFALAVDMNPSGSELEAFNERYPLRRCGYKCDGKPVILLSRLDGTNGRGSTDPGFWKGRTWPTAHTWIIENWKDIKTGDVVDVAFIMGETKEPVKSLKETQPGD